MANWSDITTMKGGCESFFNQLEIILNELNHDTKSITFDKIKDVLGLGVERNQTGFFEVEASHLIDRYCSHYSKLFPETYIISNAGITNYWYKNPKTINIFNDPYSDIMTKMIMRGLHAAHTYNKFGLICVKLQKESAKNTLANIAISDFMANEMRKMEIEPTTTIEHGIDLELFKPLKKYDIREKLGIPQDALVGVWSKEFNPATGFHIISRLAKTNKNIYWLLNFKFKTNYRPKLKNVKIIDPIEREQMPEIYNAGDFFVNTSVSESFGLCPLEAMGCNKPTILTNTGFVWEKDLKEDIAERDYGLLVNRWDYESFKDAIDIFIEKKDSFNPRKFAEKYNIKTTNMKWKKLFKEICKEKN
jgi:glycosyltransferase involved in cell wall biosynthesis